MIGSGKFLSQLELIELLLKKLGLFGSREKFPNKNTQAADFRGLNYIDVYRKYINDIAYDFLLVDQSILCFNYKGKDIHDGGLSYSYIESPVSLLSYEAFVTREFDLDPSNDRYEVDLEEIGDGYYSEYEIYLETLPVKTGVCPIRFDCDASSYREGVHPACHVHIGFENDLRIGTRNVLTPLSFFLFIVRQHYPRAWEKIRDFDDFGTFRKEVRLEIAQVHNNYWKSRDTDELYLY